jgi:ATP-binding protein involved in chromosome partitioning
VGLLDCDIYGPSIPLMMGVREKPTVSAPKNSFHPMRHGVKVMSMGFLVEDDAPVIWRGPMIMKAIQQFVTEVEWAPLDYLAGGFAAGDGRCPALAVPNRPAGWRM